MYTESEQSTVTLTDVLYVPELKKHLLPIKAASTKGWQFHFIGNTYKIMKDSRIKAFTSSNGTLYRLVENLNEYDAAATLGGMNEQNLNYETWHRRFGHLGMDKVKLMHHKEIVCNMKCTKGVINRDCEACIQGKITRKPFLKGGNNQTREVLELIHSDVCGPMPVESLAGSKYFVTFIDDSSRFTVVYFMKDKSEVFKKLKLFVA